MSPPSSIGHYKITGKVGEGGMGAVYRATDTKLNRDVAIKMLPPAFSQDLGRMARFQREAEMLAALNHPNIAAIYSIEQGALVMEMVEGEDLHGPLAIETAIDYARQIAVALEAAHEKGIIHRDLKPANIKVTPEGVVKLLDFGLAKGLEESASVASQGATMSPTMSLAMTQAGAILGTAAYMSPEQARGKPVDKRADIWAFGVVLYEMLTGGVLFAGETVTDTLASVVKETPDWTALPAETPARIRRLLDRCLRKDAKMRLQAIGEARIAIDEKEPEPEPAAAGPSPVRRKWLLPAMGGITLAAVLAAGIAWFQPHTSAPGIGPVRMPLTLPEGTGEGLFNATPQAVPSPDGRFVAFVARDLATGKGSLWVRPLDSLTAHRLDKTDEAAFPFWSPDGHFIAFFAEDKLKRIAVAGGSPQTICDVPHTGGSMTAVGEGGTWNRQGVIIFGNRLGQSLMLVHAAGGVPKSVTTIDQAAGEGRLGWPQFLPDGRHLLYFAWNRTPEKSGIYLQDLDSSHKMLLMRNVTRAAWSPPGYLLFVREGTLMAQRANARTYQLEGDPMSVTQDVTENTNNGRSAFAVSDNGVLVYRSGSGSLGRQLKWLDREGKSMGLIGKREQYRTMTLSPDEKSAAVVVNGPPSGDTWIVDLATGASTPLTRDSRDALSPPVWSPDSKRVAISGAAGGVRVIEVASGKATAVAPNVFVEDWTPDGLALLCRDIENMRLSLFPTAPEGKPQAILTTPYRINSIRFSPDGKWVAYTSSETGGSEIFVASFPGFAVKKRVSTEGGIEPVWRKDGKAIYFRTRDAWMALAEIRTTPQLEVGGPKALFRWDIGSTRGTWFAVTRDAQRFLVNEDEGRATASENVVLLNWPSGLPSQGTP